MHIDKRTGFKIRNRNTGEIKTAYQSENPWIIVDENGTEIMSDWEAVEDGWGIDVAVILTVLFAIFVSGYFFISVVL